MRVLCGPGRDISVLSLNIYIMLRTVQFCPFPAVQAESFTGRQRAINKRLGRGKPPYQWVNIRFLLMTTLPEFHFLHFGHFFRPDAPGTLGIHLGRPAVLRVPAGVEIGV